MDPKKVQEENFAKLKERVEPFLGTAPNLPESIERLKYIFSLYVILDLNWERVFELVEKAIAENDVPELDAQMKRIADACMDYDE